VLGFDEPSIAVTGSGTPVAAGEEIPEWSHTGYRPWKYIVIHHSSTEGGNAASFDRDHRARGFDELGYHFVITNANGGKDGQIEVSRRWRTQKWGAHTGRTEGNRYNNYGIGICLVGNFEVADPSAKQLAALNALVRYLVKRHGIRVEDVITHRDAPGASTVCPGRNLYRYVHATLRPELRRLGK
jgi:N-acetyl-anhydromuramyl-L-alanine amidase AmpD